MHNNVININSKLMCDISNKRDFNEKERYKVNIIGVQFKKPTVSIKPTGLVCLG